MKKLLPIGLHDYKEIREKNYYYVDKTLIIKEILESGKAVLLTRPRRFGKTLTLSTLYYFFSKSSSSNATLFSDTAIWQFPEYQALQGTYPVIFVSFRTVGDTTFEMMLKQLAYILAIEFNRHAYVLSGDILTPNEKERFQRIASEQGAEIDLGNALEFLVRMLHKYHQKKVVVLIDEYDVPVQNAFIHGFYDTIISFLKKLLTGPFKDQEILEKGVFTGNLTLAQAGIFTGLNNLDVFSLTREKMADKLGFTLQEVKEILTYYDLENRLQDMQEWYNGYTFGESPGMFNPWSVLKCVANNGKIDTYWVNTSNNILLKMLLGSASQSIKSDLELVLQGESVAQDIVESIVFPDLKSKNVLVWSLLLFTGYLTYTRSELQDDRRVWLLVIPNREIRKVLTDMIHDIFNQSVMGGSVNELLEAMLEGNTEIFSSLLQSFIINSMSTFDISNDEPEKSYHLFVLGLLVALSGNYEVRSNRESGLGRYDIMVIPNDTNKPAVVIEFKKVWPSSKETLETASQKALDQIHSKQYLQELYARNYHTIFTYGIAFQNKLVFVNAERCEHKPS